MEIDYSNTFFVTSLDDILKDSFMSHSSFFESFGFETLTIIMCKKLDTLSKLKKKMYVNVAHTVFFMNILVKFSNKLLKNVV